MAYGYRKVVQSGTLVEEYIYDRTPADQTLVLRKPRKKRPPQQRSSRNIKSCRRAFTRLVRANLSPQSVPYLITLTMRDIVSVDEAWEAHMLFCKRLRTAFKLENLKWISVPEFQKRGSIHFHLLVWGIPEYLIIHERDTRYIQNLWGYGYVDCVVTDGSPKLATYLAKYMQKAMYDERLLKKRAYYSSRNVSRPLQFSHALIATHSKEILGKNTVLVTESIFETEWLGQCHYTMLRLDDAEIPLDKEFL